MVSFQVISRWAATLSNSKRWPLYFLFPSAALITLSAAYPLTTGIVFSFREMRLTHPNKSAWVGLRNFAEMLHDPIFLVALRNTAVWTAGSITLETVLAFAVALALFRGAPGRNLFAALIFIPYFLPTVVAAELWALMLDPHAGIINHLLVGAGLLTEGYTWLADPVTALPVAIVAEAWHGFPFMTFVFLAGFNAVPTDLREAAALDGAGPWRTMIYVVLPMIYAILGIGLAIRIVALVNSPDLLLVLTGGGPGDATQVLSLYAFQVAYREFNFGYSSALSILMVVLLVLMTALILRLSRSTEGAVSIWAR